MKKVLVRILKVLGRLVAAVVVTLGGGFLMLNTDTVQNRLLKEAVAVLKERLQTQVTADHVRVSVTPLQLTLQGVTIEDREQRKHRHEQQKRKRRKPLVRARTRQSQPRRRTCR